MSKLELNYPCSFNNGKPAEFKGFYQRGMTKAKANTLDGYLEMLGDYFDGLEVYPTMSWPRPDFPFQWRAKSVHFTGDDDVWEGLGKTPLEAVRALYNNMKEFYVSISLGHFTGVTDLPNTSPETTTAATPMRNQEAQHEG